MKPAWHAGSWARPRKGTLALKLTCATSLNLNLREHEKMWLHQCKLGGLAAVIVLLLATFCPGQTNVHVDSPSKVNLNAERFAFKVDVMGTGNPTLVRRFPSADPLAAVVTIKGKPATRLLVGPDLAKSIKDPDQIVPCGETTAKVIFYFALDAKNQRALFINLQPGDGVLLDCQLNGQVEAIHIQ